MNPDNNSAGITTVIEKGHQTVGTPELTVKYEIGHKNNAPEK